MFQKDYNSQHDYKFVLIFAVIVPTSCYINDEQLQHLDSHDTTVAQRFFDFIAESCPTPTYLVKKFIQNIINGFVLFLRLYVVIRGHTVRLYW